MARPIDPKKVIFDSDDEKASSDDPRLQELKDAGKQPLIIIELSSKRDLRSRISQLEVALAAKR
jgi:hypothetical protein